MIAMRNAYKVFVGKPKGKKSLEDQVVDGKIRILGKRGRKVRTGCICLSTGTSGGLF
jgi:hypothetical protein